MTNLDKMWKELETHQPIADKKGYGAEWARMCELKTKEAAAAARGAAWPVVAAAAAASAAVAAADAMAAAEAVAAAASKRAIEYIIKANQEADHV